MVVLVPVLFTIAQGRWPPMAVCTARIAGADGSSRRLKVAGGVAWRRQRPPMAALPCEHCRQRLLPVLYIIAKAIPADGGVQRGQRALTAVHGDRSGRRRRCTAKAAAVDGGACLAVAAGGGARIASVVGSSLCRRPKAVHGVGSMLLVAAHGDGGGCRRQCTA
jgi:hypothetical protein